VPPPCDGFTFSEDELRENNQLSKGTVAFFFFSGITSIIEKMTERRFMPSEVSPHHR
jgi:hypothetical protein